MAVGEIFLTAFINVMFNKLASTEFFDFEKQVTESAMKLWLEDLRDLAYDMDDLLDAIATEAFVRMGSKIEKITNRVQEIAKQIGGLRLLRNAGGSSNARETVTTQIPGDPKFGP
ncbi:hypothetical protein CK203_024598 [Vitis vinifera]|uniref:Disease resistance N-terminal domain-containing protein n=1 Tax=Vitis vinifera TaxID=29760 RepID=A0A438IV57_VITVI|nr:hypothetical protein CK203_024598 [Vitis vinifera]